MNAAEVVAGRLLETDWDKVHAALPGLWAQRQEADRLLRELITSVSYHRALAHAGVNKQEVARPIYGGQVGATDNYKKMVPTKRCQNRYCSAAGRYFPLEQEVCPGCQEPLVDAQRPISASELRSKMTHHILGVELTDGRKIWFDEPVSDKPWLAWETKDPNRPKPNRPSGKGFDITQD